MKKSICLLIVDSACPGLMPAENIGLWWICLCFFPRTVCFLRERGKCFEPFLLFIFNGIEERIHGSRICTRSKQESPMSSVLTVATQSRLKHRLNKCQVRECRERVAILSKRKRSSVEFLNRRQGLLGFLCPFFVIWLVVSFFPS